MRLVTYSSLRGLFLTKTYAFLVKSGSACICSCFCFLVKKNPVWLVGYMYLYNNNYVYFSSDQQI